MAYLISVVNQKGGVGKTTTAINLATYLALNGRFVLLVDLDPQANATSGLGVDHNQVEAGVYEAILGERTMSEVVRKSNVDGLSLVPSTMALAGAEVELVEMDRREYRLADSLAEIRNNFDYIIIDCPPSLSLLTINGLAASDRVLIPVQAEYYALEGLSKLVRTIDLVKRGLRPELEVMGAVLTMFDSRNKLANDVLHELYKFFPNKIFRSVVPRNVRLAEAPSFGQPIVKYDPWSKGAKAYERLAREVLDLEQIL
jgi:chromosome partitioning protein